MPGYLDQYGAGEEQRNRLIIRSVIGVILVAVLTSLGWYLLQNHHQEGVVKTFLADVRRGDFQAAYRDWGCTPAKPCSDYTFDKFLRDWGNGAKDSAPDPAVLGLTDSESCSTGVLLTVAVNSTREEKLWVDRESKRDHDAISFAPYLPTDRTGRTICPNKSAFANMVHFTIGRLRKPLLH